MPKPKKPMFAAGSEAAHQVEVLKHCEKMGWQAYATDQASPSGSMGPNGWRVNFNNLRKRKALGVRSGLPDLVVFVMDGEFERVKMAFVEMKKPKGPRGGKAGSEILPEQVVFETYCAACGIPFKFCFGAQDAIGFLNGIRSTLER